jgi:hypothetical protein
MKNDLLTGLNSIKEVYIQLAYKNCDENPDLNEELSSNESEVNEIEESDESNSSENHNKKVFAQSEDENAEYNDEITINRLKMEIEAEVIKYQQIINSNFFIEKKFSTDQFWTKHNLPYLKDIYLPHLSKLYTILSNIPSSSAFIERFFSVCGIVCKKRSLAMLDDLIIKRSVLKSNMVLLNKMNLTEETDEENE